MSLSLRPAPPPGFVPERSLAPAIPLPRVKPPAPPPGFVLEGAPAPKRAAPPPPPPGFVLETAAAPDTGSYTAEIAKGVPRGVIGAVGTGIKGLAGTLRGGAADINQRQLDVIARIDAGQSVPEMEDPAGYQHMDVAQRAQYKAELARPTLPIKDTTLFQVGESVGEFGAETLKPAPGWEQSWTAQISEGVGSTIPFIAAAPFGGGGMAASVLAGSMMSAGESIERAMAEGATEEQIAEAVRLGKYPGLTEVLPIEVLFSRIPVAHLGKFAVITGKAIATAAAEGGQEAAQQFAQNLISRYVYNPEQDLAEGVAEAGALGSIIGGGFGTVAGGIEAVTAPAPGERAAPPEAIQAPPPGFAPAAPASDAVPADDTSVLLAAGYTAEQIADMAPAEAANEALLAREAGVVPAAIPSAPAPEAPPAASIAPPEAVPDEPTAEPLSDIEAQLGDLVDPTSDRGAVWLPSDTVAHMLESGGEPLLAAALAAGAVPVEDFDGKGGVLLAEDQEAAEAAVEARDRGVPLQKIIGVLTGAGEGKRPDATAVVQQVTPEGQVTRETIVPAEEAPAAEQAFQAPDRTVQTVDPVDALARREEMVEAERPATEPAQNIPQNIPAPAPGTAPMAPRTPKPPKGFVLEQPTAAPPAPVEAATPPPPPGFVPETHFPAPRAPRRRRPKGMMAKPVTDMLKTAGGVDPQSPLAGELRHMGITPTTAPGLFKAGGIGAVDNFPPGNYPIFRDHVEGHYIKPEAILDALRDEHNGKPWRTDEQAQTIRDKEAEANFAEQGAQIEHEIDLALERVGMTRADWAPEQVEQARRMVSEGVPALDAFETLGQEAIEAELQDTGRALLKAEDRSDIPFYDEASDEVHEPAAPEPRASGETGGVQGEGRDRPRDTAAAEQVPPRPRPGGTELGADGKPQLVIPGAEREGVATTVQRKADSPLKPKAAQKPADIGLFGDDRHQTDLIDTIRRVPAPPPGFEIERPAADLSEAFRDQMLGDGFPSILAARKFATERGQALQVLTAMQAEGAVFQTVANQDIATEIVGKTEPPPPPKRAALESRSTAPASEPVFSSPQHLHDERWANAAARVLERKPEIRDELQSLADRYLGHGLAKVHIKPLLDPEGRKGGTYNPDDAAIFIALATRADPVVTLRHETIHAMRENGLITKPEWGVLARRAQAEWLERFNTRERYANYRETLDLTEAQLEEIMLEEAVADAWGRWPVDQAVDSALRGDTLVARIIEKVMRFLDAVRNMLAGHGYSTAEDVFKAFETGVTATRPRREEGRGFGVYARDSTNKLAALENYTQTEAFRRWFGKSKVVDAKGKPLVVYHGTDKSFDSFDPKRIGRRQREKLGGFFFTNETEYASVVAEGRGGNVMPVYLKIENPLIVDVKKAHPDDYYFNAQPMDLENQARRDGKDGVILHSDRGEAIYVAFEPEQIKSATGNRGTFDPRKRSILEDRGPMKPPAGAKTPTGTSWATGSRIASRVQALTDPARVGIQDRFLAIKRMQQALEEEVGFRIATPIDVYQAIRLYVGKAGEQQLDIKKHHVEPLIEDMRERKITGAQLDEYLYARHAPERNREMAKINPEIGRAGSGMSDAKAAAIIDAIRAAGKFADYEVLARRVDALNAETRRRQVAAGLISPETEALWKSTYEHYVPLRGFDDIAADADSHGIGTPSGRGFDVRGPESKRALGRRSKADSPLTYSIHQALQSVVRAEKNRVLKVVLRFAQEQSERHPGLFKIDKAEMRRRLNPETGVVETYAVPPQFSKADNLFAVKLGGKTHYLEVKHQGYARALRGVGSSIDNAVANTLMRVAHTYSAMLTQWNPEFVPVNAVRDIQTALVNVSQFDDLAKGTKRKILKEAFTLKSIRGALAAMYDRPTSNEMKAWFSEYRLAGGKVSFLERNDVDQIKRRIDRAMKAGHVMRGLAGLADLVGNVNTAVENGVRLSVYANLRKNGVEKSKAAFIARDLTTDFNLHGEWSPVINAMYIFFNASLQGSMRLARGAAQSRKVRVAIAGIAAFGFASEFYNALMSGGDEGEDPYDDIPDWKRENNMIVMLPDGNHITFPLAYGYNAPFVAGQQLAAALRGARTPAEAAMTVGAATMSSFNPLGSFGSLLQFGAPWLLDPLAQSRENKTFYGGPVMPTIYDKKKPLSETYFKSAPEWAKAVARELNTATGGTVGRGGYIDISPNTIEHYAEFIAGGVGKFLVRAYNTGERLVAGEEFLPEKMPLLRRFYSRADTVAAIERRFFDAWSEVDQAHYELAQLRKAGDRERANAVAQQRRAELRAYRPFKAAQDIRAEGRKDRVLAEKITDKAARQQRIDAIENRERQMMLRALRAYRPDAE